ncbi:MAG: 2-phosphosulfolactate phosphatase, partial [Gammaproteobacteria bacterium]
MRCRRATLADCHAATGAVVVIDVLRAFTTAAHAFARGAREILLVATVEEALALRARHPGSLIIGEVDALPVPGFDLPNSPAALARLDLTGRCLIQRTTAGTQGICRAPRDRPLFAASLCNASATARHLRALGAEIVTLVETGRRDSDSGDEDRACADLLEMLLAGDEPDLPGIAARVHQAPAAAKFADPARPEFPAEDLPLAA